MHTPSQPPERGSGRRKYVRKTFEPRFLKPGDELKLPNEIGGELDRQEDVTGFDEVDEEEPEHAVPDASLPLSDAEESVAEALAVETDGDLVDIWQRRMLNPFGTSAPTIRIKRPGMHLRWINLSVRGRYQRARFDHGYMPVTKDLLMDEREVWGVTYTSEGYVCRGEKQSEMLMMIPKAVYREIQLRKAARNEESYRKLKDSMAQAGAGHFSNKYGGSAGDQAADLSTRFKGTINFGTEREQS